MRHGEFTVSETGVLVYTGGMRLTDERLDWLDRSGKKLGVLDAAPHMEISPDGARVAADRLDQNGQRNIWIHDTRRGTRSRVTFSPGTNWVPAWSPDGARIAFTSDTGGPPGVAHIYLKLASGAGSDELLLRTDQHKHHLDWSRDGRFLAFESLHPQNGWDLWVLPMAAGEGKPILFLQTGFNEGQPQFSPDGRFLAYVSDESGTFETYAQAFPPTGGKWQVSAAGGLSPRWRRDGRELFYLAPGGAIMAVDVDPKGPIFGVPRPLFQAAVTGDSMTGHFAVAPDGQRFLVRGLVHGDERPPITVVLNWASQLPRNN